MPMKKYASDDPDRRPPVRVAAVGLRGIPHVQGGIESHAQSLYPLLAATGFDVTVHARRAFLAPDAPRQWQGVRIDPSWSPTKAGVEALIHTMLATLRAARQGADILHIHGIGPAIVTPLARLLGFRVVVTHHGKDYERDKWGRFAKWLLRTGEAWGARFAHRMICVSQNDADRINATFGNDVARAIPNGAPRLAPPDAPAVLGQLGLTPGRYLLNVARLVPEKRQAALIAAFGRLAPPGWKLVLVGSAQNRSDYPAELERAARSVPGCVLAGQRGGAELSTLYANAAFFVLPSSHEGLPITLLEALSFGLPCLASDISANREIGLPATQYFAVDDFDALVRCLRREIENAERAPARAGGQQSLQRLPAAFRWESVADTTARLFEEVAGRKVLVTTED
ncbi:MAG: glycosyltransferase family 4 protein [Lautropia sp.]